jgi:hypothetical protein
MGQNVHAGIPAVVTKSLCFQTPNWVGLAEVVNEIIDIYQSDTKRLVISIHPNTPEIMHALCQPLTLGPNECCVLHVVGTDSDHHVRIAVEMAAQ